METKVVANERIINLLLACAKVTCEHQDDDERCIRLCSELFLTIRELEYVNNCRYFYSSEVYNLLGLEKHG